MSKNKKKIKICCKCNEEKRLDDDYYLASSDLLYSDNRLPICKLCLESVIDFENPKSVLDIMRRIDRPFLIQEYEASINGDYKVPFREYMRRLAMPQNRNLTYNDSVLGTADIKIPTGNEIKASISKEFDDDFNIKWGEGYTDIEIQQLETFYRDMVRANDIQTPQHVEQLKLLCKVNLEQNKALAEKRINDFKNLNSQYNQILRDSGFRPIDRQSGGESAGIRTFSQIWEEIEKDGFIKPAPIGENQDIVDKTIMYMANYTRKLLNINSLSEPPKDTPKVDGGNNEL